MKFTFLSMANELSGLSSRTLCAYVKSIGHEAKIIFLPTPVILSSYSQTVLDNLISLLKGTDIVGISVITPHYFLASQLSAEIRQKTKAKVLWGGIHATVRPEQCLEHADWVCVGEGEPVLKSIADGEEISRIPGLWYRDNGVIVKTGHSEMIRDLSSLPFLDFTFDDHYFLDPARPEAQPIKLTKTVYYENCSKKYKDSTGRYRCFYKTLTTRGCPFSCAYCNNSVHHSMYTPRHFRRRPLDDVLEELETVCRQSGIIEYIHFADDNFLARSKEEILDFCEEYKERINLPFRVISSADTLTEETMPSLVEAGLCDVCMGIQSGSKRGLTRYNRKIDKETNLKTARLINRYKDRVSTYYDIICNDPLGDPDEVWETIVFLSRFPKPRTFVYFNLVFFPGTQINAQAARAGLIEDEIKEVYSSSYSFKPANYYDLLLLMLNLDHIPRWVVRLLSRRWIYKSTIRFPGLNRLAFSLYDKAVVNINSFLRLVKQGEVRVALRGIFRAAKLVGSSGKDI